METVTKPEWHGVRASLRRSAAVACICAAASLGGMLGIRTDTAATQGTEHEQQRTLEFNVQKDIDSAYARLGFQITENWAGYVAFPDAVGLNGRVTGVSGSWIVQDGKAVDGLAQSTQWVGIGGQYRGDNTLIQAGTTVVHRGALMKSIVWYELLPMPMVYIEGLEVKPGDAVGISIKEAARGGPLWTIQIDNITRDERANIVVAYESYRLNADWIDERVCIRDLDGNEAYVPLVKFKAAYFGGQFTPTGSNAVYVDGKRFGIGELRNIKKLINYRNGKEDVWVTPSGLGEDGSSFLVLYDSVPLGVGPSKRR